MASIQIEGVTVQKGLFSFLSEALDDPTIENLVLDMERNYYRDQHDFIHKMRLLLEGFIIHEFFRVYPGERDKLANQTWDRVIDEKMIAMKEAGQLPRGIVYSSGHKLFWASRCCREECYPEFYKHAVPLLPRSHKIPPSLAVAKLYSELYGRCSSASGHMNDGDEKIDATRDNCRKTAELLFYTMLAYCRCFYPDSTRYNNLDFNEDRMLIDDYIPLSVSAQRKLGLKPFQGMRYYVRQEGGMIKYYLICLTNRMDQDRELDALQRLWQDEGRINRSRFVQKMPSLECRTEKRIPDKEQERSVFLLGGKPRSLSQDTLRDLSIRNREQLFLDAKTAISALHGAEPPMYHRAITPDAFALCGTSSRSSLILCAFSCVKETDEDVQYTVADLVSENRHRAQNVEFYAPELVGRHSCDISAEEWKKADMYSLGILGVYLLTGGTDASRLDGVEGISPKTREFIRKICAPADSRLSEEDEFSDEL
ncbi:MAG: hypothetical protein MSH58_05610 [Clostridiales bacterium]|nr:hypothetical protein [Clostridiales bacterium]